MHSSRYSEAVAAIAWLSLSESNVRLANYWLSLWLDDQPPSRTAFSPSKALEFLPGIALFDFNFAGDISCRLAGTAVDAGLGFALTGKQFLSFVSGADRTTRQNRLGRVVAGGVATAKSTYTDGRGDMRTFENLHLPFSGVTETGSRQFLIHTNVRPSLQDKWHRPAKWHAGLPDEFNLRSFA